VIGKYLATVVVIMGLHCPFLYSQIVINEVSQGPSGSKEYVELLVTGSGCNACVDIRGWIIDDNNGWHDSPMGTGQGIASGCMRFAYDIQWSCVPAGTLILIYNDGDPNSDIPSIDETDSNNDCVYIIPSSSTFLEASNSSPSSSTFTDYSAIVFSPGGSWNSTSMSNSNDSYQVTDPNNTSTPYFSIGWGNNDELQNVYFPGSVTGDVMYMTNSVDNDPFNVSNWVVGSASTDQTPGSANNAANATWINTLSNSCNPTAPVLSLISAANPLCNGDCNGSAVISASGSMAPYTYQWDDPSNQTTGTATGLCSGTYYPYVTDANGCADTLEVVVSDPLSLSAPVSGGVAVCNCSCPGSLYVMPSGGTPNYSVIWSNGYTDQFQTGICMGAFSVTVTDSNGCTANGSITLP